MIIAKNCDGSKDNNKSEPQKSCLDEIMIIIMHTVTEVSAMIPEQWFSVQQTPLH